MKLRLIPQWRREVKRLWSIRAAIFWGCVVALPGLFPALMDHMEPITFIVVGTLLTAVSIAVRLLKQKELHDED